MDKNKLKTALDLYNITLSDDKLSKLCEFNDDLLEYNKIHNLTSITEECDVIYKHFLDSLLFCDKIYDITSNFSAKGIDIGCGAGFPSIPLCITNDRIRISALDSVKKKTTFVEQEKSKLHLDNLNVLNARVEDIAKNPNTRESFDFVISRAVAPLNTIIEYSAPLLVIGGKIIAYKGSNYLDELNEAKTALKLLNCQVIDVISKDIKEIDAKRSLIIIEKLDETPKSYPRPQNKPRLQPIK